MKRLPWPSHTDFLKLHEKVPSGIKTHTQISGMTLTYAPCGISLQARRCHYIILRHVTLRCVTIQAGPSQLCMPMGHCSQVDAVQKDMSQFKCGSYYMTTAMTCFSFWFPFSTLTLASLQSSVAQHSQSVAFHNDDQLPLFWMMTVQKYVQARYLCAHCAHTHW